MSEPRRDREAIATRSGRELKCVHVTAFSALSLVIIAQRHEKPTMKVVFSEPLDTAEDTVR
jgi:hypothetical protein